MTSGITPFPFGVTVEVHRAPEGRNQFGDLVREFHHEIEGCALAPRYSSDLNDNQNRVIVGFTLYGPSQEGDNRVFADDRIKTPDGNFYDVQGEAVDWDHPMNGWAPGFEAALERVT